MLPWYLQFSSKLTNLQALLQVTQWELLLPVQQLGQLLLLWQQPMHQLLSQVSHNTLILTFVPLVLSLYHSIVIHLVTKYTYIFFLSPTDSSVGGSTTATMTTTGEDESHGEFCVFMTIIFCCGMITSFNLSFWRSSSGGNLQRLNSWITYC